LHALRAHIAIRRGELHVARQAAAEAEAEILRSGPQFGIDWLMWAKALLVEDADPVQARTILDNAWALYEMLGAVTHCHTLGPDLVRLAVRTGDHERAAAITTRVEAVGELLGTATARGGALRCRGLLDDDPDVLRAAVAALRTGPRPAELAAACEDAALALTRRHQTLEAAALAAEALTLYDRLGATREAGRAAAGFRAAGLRSSRRDRRRRPATGWSSLTASEHNVADLVARGLTNREIGQRLFISPRTVETHLAHVYAKLGLSSRAALAATVTAEAATRAS
jgi:DNA-binding CsgD family transcriptional regulator